MAGAPPPAPPPHNPPPPQPPPTPPLGGGGGGAVAQQVGGEGLRECTLTSPPCKARFSPQRPWSRHRHATHLMKQQSQETPGMVKRDGKGNVEGHAMLRLYTCKHRFAVAGPWLLRVLSQSKIYKRPAEERKGGRKEPRMKRGVQSSNANQRCQNRPKGGDQRRKGKSREQGVLLLQGEHALSAAAAALRAGATSHMRRPLLVARTNLFPLKFTSRSPQVAARPAPACLLHAEPRWGVHRACSPVQR